MFKDTQKELQRLQAQLLQEEEHEHSKDALLDDPGDFGEEVPDIYRNYANNYRAYNSDTSDEDLDTFSEEVRNPSRRSDIWALCAVAIALLAGILAILAWWAVHMGG